VKENWWNNKKLSGKEKEELLVETCRKVFSTDDGKIVLNMLLTDLRLFMDSHTKREKILNDYAKFFVRERLGVRDTKSLTDYIAETAAAAGGK